MRRSASARAGGTVRLEDLPSWAPVPTAGIAQLRQSTSSHKGMSYSLASPSMDNRAADTCQRSPSASTYLLENGTNATFGRDQGPASRDPLPFLGMTCWPLLGGV